MTINAYLTNVPASPASRVSPETRHNAMLYRLYAAIAVQEYRDRKEGAGTCQRPGFTSESPAESAAGERSVAVK